MVKPDGQTFVFDVVNQSFKPSLQLQLAAIEHKQLVLSSDGSMLLVMQHQSAFGWVFDAYLLEGTLKLRVLSPVRLAQPLSGAMGALSAEVRRYEGNVLESTVQILDADAVNLNAGCCMLFLLR